MTKPLSRRTVLRGLGSAMALPLLDAMGPRSLSNVAKAASSAATTVGPRRMAFIFIPNGAIPDAFKTDATGADYTLPSSLAPLADLKNDILVMDGLTADKARANGDGAGDHARCSAAYLTASQPRKTSGADIRVGISVDQVAAENVGHFTRLPSIELGTDPGRNVGQCDSGYSCAYSSNISWKSPESPMAKEVNPRAVFERLFGNDANREAARERAKRNLYKKSILDLVADDAQRLQGELGAADKRKVDEYFESIRQIELRVAKADEQRESEWAPNYEKPNGVPKDFGEHLRLMGDMIALAFQGDVTRVSTLMFANAGSNKSYRPIGVSEGHHSLSHHNHNPEKMEAIRKIDKYHVEQFAYLLKKLKGIKEGNGTLLDNCMIVYGSGINDANRHSHHDLPIILAGRGGGTIKPGRSIRYPRETPLANLFLELLDRMNVHTEHFGDSTGRLGQLT
jgi:Protein of unknown function (DUF1552)